MSNVSVILCVPCLIKDNCYSIIDIVTEPMQCKISTSMLVKNTNKIGAFKRVDGKNESQRLSVKMIDDNIYNVELVDSIQRNQMNGDTPNYCIPLMINAITVQGISYSDPYFSSFNFNYKEMALGAPVYMNKSDYAFKSSLCIIQDEPCISKMRLLNGKSAKDMLCETNKSRMNDCDKSKRKDHDNNVSRGSYGAGTDLTFDAMLELVENEGRVLKALAAVEPVDSWGKPRRLRLCGGGETSLNAASGWGTPPASNNNAGNWGGNPSGQSNNGTNNTQAQWNNTTQRPPTSQAENAIIPGNGNGGNSPNSISNSNGPTPGNGNGNSNITSSAKIEQLNSMREALFSQDGWGGQHVNQDTNWDVPGSPEPGSGVKAEPGPAGGPPAWKPNATNGAFLGTDLWEANLRNGGAPPPPAAAKTPWGHTPTTNIGGTWGEDDDTDQGNVWNGPPPAVWTGPAPPPPQWTPHKKDDWNAWGEPPRPDVHYEPPRPPADPRHDLRGGISGRLNGDMWHHPPKAAPPPAAWPHRDEPSPPARRANPNYEDGTSLWGQRAARPPPHRLPPPANKPDVWGQPPAAPRAWDDPHAAPWTDRDQHWPDAAQGLWPNSKPKPPPGPGAPWPDDIGEWGGPKPTGASAGSLGKQIPKEMIWNSKQFRYLIELGYKKEEAEAALRSRDMNVEEAVELLAAARGEPWRREEFSFAPPAVKHMAPPNQFGTGAPPPQSQPSTQQLRMLVQQIQMAVTAGYLNHQILNQPLAPQTLVLLNQLLQQIKVLQQLVQQHSLAISKANSSLALQCSVQITKAKQQITALQNQIATQQALYMKQQPGNTGGGDLFKQNPDPLAQLQNNFTDMAIAKESQPGYGASGNQQSRLNKWKLPSLDKDDDNSEFSRAPGTAKSTTSPQLNQLGLQHDSTWALGRGGGGVGGVGGVGVGGEGWGEGADVGDGKDWPSHPPVYDLVPEFEPGKPWKGNQMKNVEDDPAMTPGSVGRSPLSLPLKEVGGKVSPVGGAGGERSLTNSTWSYAPPNAAKPHAADAWGKPRPQNNKPWPHNNRQVPPTWQASTWLLLKNLTAQIDGSTLKTLCVQHGPLQDFHLYLNQGIALARYSSREEAAKAQMALNNCVLSNTTIFAESPGESDVQMLLQHLGTGGGGSWRGPGGGAGGGKDWYPPHVGPWTDPGRNTPSGPSLNSFLPPDLLSGESL